MNQKISSEVQAALNEIDGNTYVRLHCWLHDPQISNEHRKQLADDMHCTHMMQTSRLVEIEIPRRFVEEIATWEEVKQIKTIKVV